MLRTPAYPYTSYQNIDFLFLLSNQFFLAAIKTASSAVYEQLEKAEFNEEKLTTKMKFTLMRYLNRMCFRPTPFGLCSGVSVVRWGSDSVMKLDSKLNALIKPGFSDVLKIADKILSEGKSELYQTNETIYAVGKEYRFIRIISDDSSKRKYVIDTVCRTVYLDALLHHCKKVESLESLVRFMVEAFKGRPDDCNKFLQQLITAQLLVPALQPNITGQDYLDRVTKNSDISFRRNLYSLDPEENINTQLNLFTENAYINASRKVEGSISNSFQGKIIEGMQALDILVPNKISESLKEFTDSFIRKFDRQTIPLLKALDPETGVAYGNLGGDYIKPFFEIEEPTNSTLPAGRWSDVHSLLLKKMNVVRSDDKGKISLTEEDLKSVRYDRDALEIPPTTSVMFRIAGPCVFLEQAGGATGTSLTGRFTTLSKDLNNLGKGIAMLEENVNPEVIFAEIAHFSDDHIANIERRNKLYSYEIPILTGSALGGKNKIPLRDLLVSVQNGKIVLRSATLKKLIIPRFSSAYNYTRSDLAVFRFLCDLQHQGLQLKATFHLENYFPGLDHYPRVNYKDAILQLATWKIKTDEYTYLRNSEDRKLKIGEMRKLVSKLSLPRHISVDVHDNQLIFDTTDDSNLELLSYSFKPGILTIKEFPFTTDSVVNDYKGRPYISQFVATLHQPGPLYNDINKEHSVKKELRKFMPLQEWAFFKLYCHHTRANEMLTQFIYPTVKRLQGRLIIKNWFYIRYTDNGFHIRLRIQADKKYIARLPALLWNLLSEPLKQGLIENAEICTYERELERYPAEVIDLVERSFSHSAALILQFITTSQTDESQPGHYRFPVSTIAVMVDAFEIGFKDRVDLFKNLYQGFEKEFSISWNQLNSKLRYIRKAGILNDLNEINGKQYNSTELMSFYDIHCRLSNDTQTWSRDKRFQLIADLIHMHLNRFFVKNARRQELMMYYCLYKGYESVLAIKKAIPIKISKNA